MKRKTLALGLVAALTALPAAAHHSFDMFFDRAKSVGLTGTVTEFTFGNPHVYFKLAVAGPDGSAQEWHIETTNPNTLEPRGWGPDSIKPGQALVIEAWPARNGRPYARLRSMTNADRTPVNLWLPDGPSVVNPS